MKQERSAPARSIRFFITGVLVNASLYVVLWALLRFGLDYRIAATLVYLLGMTWGYLQNRLWSWRSNAPVIRSASLYVAVYGFMYVLHMFIVTMFVELASLPPLVAVLASSALLVVPLFILLDKVIFKRREI